MKLKYIIQSREAQCKFSKVLGDDPEIFKALRQSKSAIVDEVRRFCHKGWPSIAFHLGDLQKEAVPTVLVFVCKGLRANLGMLEYHLLLILGALRVTIKFDILIGSITAAGSRVHEKAVTYWEPPPEYAANGCSINFRGNKEDAGTLGGCNIESAMASPSKGWTNLLPSSGQ